MTKIIAIYDNDLIYLTNNENLQKICKSIHLKIENELKYFYQYKFIYYYINNTILVFYLGETKLKAFCGLMLIYNLNTNELIYPIDNKTLKKFLASKKLFGIITNYVVYPL